jgi:hypothetical protein
MLEGLSATSAKMRMRPPTVEEQSIGDMVLVVIGGLEAGADSTDERGQWNEPDWEIVETRGSRIL